ncbi:MAG: hypothetical protein ACLTDV_06120 [Eubacterium sp.]
MSERYINDRFLPDQAIDLMDEICFQSAYPAVAGGVAATGRDKTDYAATRWRKWKRRSCGKSDTWQASVSNARN